MTHSVGMGMAGVDLPTPRTEKLTGSSLQWSNNYCCAMVTLVENLSPQGVCKLFAGVVSNTYYRFRLGWDQVGVNINLK